MTGSLILYSVRTLRIQSSDKFRLKVCTRNFSVLSGESWRPFHRTLSPNIISVDKKTGGTIYEDSSPDTQILYKVEVHDLWSTSFVATPKKCDVRRTSCGHVCGVFTFSAASFRIQSIQDGMLSLDFLVVALQRIKCLIGILISVVEIGYDNFED